MTSSMTVHVTVAGGSDLATWLAAIGTVAAVIVALGALVFQNRSFRQEQYARLKAEQETSFLRKSEQARKISSYTTGGGGAPAVLNVINASDAQVIPFEAVAIIKDYPRPGATWRGSFLPLGVVNVVPPGPSTRGSVLPPPNAVNFRHEIAFTDDNGVRWHKYGPDGLHEVDAQFTLLADLDWDPSMSQIRP
jgi:hypothetical protein